MAPHHAVDHAAGGDHVGAGLGMADALLGQKRQRGIVVDVEPAAVFAQHAAMAMIGVFAETFIGDEQHVLVGRPHGSQRLLHDAVVGQALEPVASLWAGMPKNMNARNPRSAAAPTSSTSRSTLS